MNQIKKLLKDKTWARWTVLATISLTMMTAYILSDVMAPLKTMLEQQLGWDSGDYGLFTSGYGLINIFLLMLIFGGMILDRMGARFTGVLAVIIMMVGTLVKYLAISGILGDSSLYTLKFGSWELFSARTDVLYATLGFAILGVGIEMIGITANKIVVKWFKGRNMALAIGLNTAAGRVGTAIALAGSEPFARAMGYPGAPLLLCLLLLCIGLMTFIVYIMIDLKADREAATTEEATGEDEKFHFRDIVSIAKIRAFWYIAILCVLFYSAVFPFLKYATELMIQKFGVDEGVAGTIPALLPFGNILLTPLFGSLYDRKGKGATIMLIGSIMLVGVHLIFSIPALNQSWQAIFLILVLGAAFSLVPSAMWPSVAKIIPFSKLGTAYSMIFWIQNWGLSFVPALIGWVLNQYCVVGTTIISGQEATKFDYTIPMLIFSLFGTLSILFAFLLRREDAKCGYGLEKPNMSK